MFLHKISHESSLRVCFQLIMISLLMLMLVTDASAFFNRQSASHEWELYDGYSLWDPVILIVLLILFTLREEGLGSTFNLIIGLMFWVILIGLPIYGAAKYSGIGFLVGLGFSCVILVFVWYRARKE